MRKKLIRRMTAIGICLMILLLNVTVQVTYAFFGKDNSGVKNSNRGGHGLITQNACYSPALKDFVEQKGEPANQKYLDKEHLNLLLYYVAEADDPEEKKFVANLGESYSQINIKHVDGEISAIKIMKKPEDPNAVCHCVRKVYKNLYEDPRFYNSIEMLNLAIELKQLALKPTDRSKNISLQNQEIKLKSDYKKQSVRILANGLHLIQDYFAHLNAPGALSEDPKTLKTTGSHGVSVNKRDDNKNGITDYEELVLIDTNKDGVPDTDVNSVLDSLAWDCHSGNDGSDESLMSADVFNPSYWHYIENWEENLEKNWRYRAAYSVSAEYLKAYLIDENDTQYLNALKSGFVVMEGKKQYIDLLTRK